MKSSVPFVLLILLLCSVAAAQDEHISIGKIVRLPSRVLNEERTLLVSLPTGYEQDTGRYPVLYLLDAETHFRHVAALVEYLGSTGEMAPVIVIGIVNTDRERDMTPKTYDRFPTSGGAEKLLRFLEVELLPYVDRQYRTAAYRILCGYSLCGTFTLYAGCTRPGLFQAQIAISPSEIIGRTEAYFLPVFLEQSGREKRAMNASCYMTVGGDETSAQKEYVADICKKLKSAGFEGMRIEEKTMDSESHAMVVPASFAWAFKQLFADWVAPDTVALRGAPALMEYYRRWGITVPPEAPLNAIGYRLAASRNLQKASEVLRINCTNFPKSANAFDSLAEILVFSGDREGARLNYERAYQLAIETNDPRREIFKSNRDRFLKSLLK